MRSTRQWLSLHPAPAGRSIRKRKQSLVFAAASRPAANLDSAGTPLSPQPLTHSRRRDGSDATPPTASRLAIPHSAHPSNSRTPRCQAKDKKTEILLNQLLTKCSHAARVQTAQRIL